MDVFISWSGERSRAAAEALRGWLPKIINAIKPWLSSADIDKGARWGTDVAIRLEAAKAGIICLTPSNLHSDWILFEAGALSKTLKNTFVCPLLVGLEPTDVKGPLAQFQATRAVKEEFLQLLKTLNGALGDSALPDSHIDDVFEVWWPRLHDQFSKLPPDGSTSIPSRTERDLLEEILQYVRNQSRTVTTGTDLSEDDRREIIKGRIERTVRSLDKTVGPISYWASGRAVNMTLDASGKQYDVVIPIDTDLDEVPAKTLAQIQGPNDKTGQPGE